jgi:hypothetical protein
MKFKILSLNVGVGTNSFTIHFNKERNWLYMVIREMWAGKVVAQAMKDVMMVQHAIQNTLLIDAVIARLYKTVNFSVASLCFISDYVYNKLYKYLSCTVYGHKKCKCKFHIQVMRFKCCYIFLVLQDHLAALLSIQN